MEIIQANCIDGLKTRPEKSVQMCVTSPPYYCLRDYGADGQIGLEETPELYVSKLVQVFREVRRVLADDGTLWLNLGDSYASTPTSSVGNHVGLTGGGNSQTKALGLPDKSRLPGLKPKDMIGIPWMVAFALRADGWYLRSDIIWHKPNPMPESVRDRPTKSHEYLFLFSKSGTTQFYTHRDRPYQEKHFEKPEPDYRWINRKTGEEFSYEPDGWESDKKTWSRLNLWRGCDYYYDYEAILEPAAYDGRKDTRYKGGEKDMNGGAHERWPRVMPGIGPKHGKKRDRGEEYKPMRGYKTKSQLPDNQNHGGAIEAHEVEGIPARNKRDVWAIDEDEFVQFLQWKAEQEENIKDIWSIPTKPYKGAHFATFPPALIEPCLLAGSRAGDVVLDPFNGSGTTGEVALRLGRDYLGFELNPEYIKLSLERLSKVQIKLMP